MRLSFSSAADAVWASAAGLAGRNRSATQAPSAYRVAHCGSLYVRAMAVVWRVHRIELMVASNGASMYYGSTLRVTTDAGSDDAFERSVPLRAAAVSYFDTGAAGRPHAFTITTEDARVLVLAASSEDDARRWVHAIGEGVLLCTDEAYANEHMERTAATTLQAAWRNHAIRSRGNARGREAEQGGSPAGAAGESVKLR